MLIKVSFFLIICILCILIAYRMQNFTNEDIHVDCICAFDLDDTLTCGLDRAADAINICKTLGCKIAINTARPSKWYHDLDLNALGLTPKDFDSDFYHGEAYQCSFGDKKCMEDTIGSTKVKHLQTLATKFSVQPNRVILFDDQHYNITKAQQAGFSTVLANHYACGLPSDTPKQIQKILN